MSGPSITKSVNATPSWEISNSPVASDGVILPMASLSQVLAYDGSNNLQTITVTYLGHTYVQTFTMTGSNVTGISAWVKTS